jgi:hypothetical protein
MDSMGTTIMNTTGTADPSGKTLTFTGAIDDYTTGKKANFKNVITVVDNDHHTFEMWWPGPDGKLFKTMEIQYARKK